jgi:hypothetical protein
MTSLLQARIQGNVAAIADQAASGGSVLPPHLLEPATFGAYIGCFRVMAIIMALITPGILLFRVARPNPAVTSVA